MSTQKELPSFASVAIGIAFFSFGFTMLVLAFAYTNDLATLASAPSVIWSAICGQPSDSPLVLPLMVTMSMLSLLLGLALLLRHWLLRRPR